MEVRRRRRGYSPDAVRCATAPHARRLHRPHSTGRSASGGSRSCDNRNEVKRQREPCRSGCSPTGPISRRVRCAQLSNHVPFRTTQNLTLSSRSFPVGPMDQWASNQREFAATDCLKLFPILLGRISRKRRRRTRRYYCRSSCRGISVRCTIFDETGGCKRLDGNNRLRKISRLQRPENQRTLLETPRSGHSKRVA